MNNNFNIPVLFIATTITALMCDLGQFFFLSKLFLPLLLSMYCALLFLDLRNGPLLFIAIITCLESFCFYGYLSLPLLYFIPITHLALLFKNNLYPSISHCITYAALCTVIQLYIIEDLLLTTKPTIDYTMIKISATIILGIFFSLTIKYWGMQDNRA
jgi:hypothetical protein